MVGSGSGAHAGAIRGEGDITARYLQQLEAAEFGASLAVLIRLRRALDCRWDTLLEKID